MTSRELLPAANRARAFAARSTATLRPSHESLLSRPPQWRPFSSTTTISTTSMTTPTTPSQAPASRAPPIGIGMPPPSLLSARMQLQQQHTSHRAVSESAAMRSPYGSPRLSGPIDAQTSAPPLDLSAQLLRSGHAVVKARTGSVLSRGFIMKTDHYPSGACLLLRPYAIKRADRVYR
jgi:hypothetical protein